MDGALISPWHTPPTCPAWIRMRGEVPCISRPSGSPPPRRAVGSQSMSPGSETADVLETSVPAVNSALQRAHAAMRQHLPQRRTEWPPGTETTAAERELLERYIAFSETPDQAGLKRLLSDDVRFSMPPHPGVCEGRDNVVDCASRAASAPRRSARCAA